MCSTDPVVRSIATEETKKESKLEQSVFRPFAKVVEVLKEDPGITKREMTDQAKKKVEAMDNEARLSHCTSLTAQGQTACSFQGEQSKHDPAQSRRFQRAFSSSPSMQ